MAQKQPRSVHSAEYRAFVTRLRRARRERGMTQWLAADKLGRTQSYIAKCESGERSVNAVELQEFARLYRKKVTYFLPE